MAKQQQLPAVVSGPINAVPCPNCGKSNSFAGQHEIVDTGNVFECKHCKQMMQICGIRMVKVISLRKPVGPVTRLKRDR